MAAMLREVRRRRFDLAVAFRDSFSNSQAWLAYASGARWRLGPEARGKKKRWGFYYNLPAPWPPHQDHEVLRCMSLLGHIGLDSPPGKLYLKVPEDSRAKVAKLFATYAIGPCWSPGGAQHNPLGLSPGVHLAGPQVPAAGSGAGHTPRRGGRHSCSGETNPG